MANKSVDYLNVGRFERNFAGVRTLCIPTSKSGREVDTEGLKMAKCFWQLLTQSMFARDSMSGPTYQIHQELPVAS